MAELSSRSLFSGSEEIDPNDLGCCEVNNFHTNVDQRLREHFRWKGKAIGVIGLTLSPGNDKVASGMLVTRGTTIHKDMNIQCPDVWGMASQGIRLVINFPTLDIFRFDHNTVHFFQDTILLIFTADV
jgi:hypothetical protein